MGATRAAVLANSKGVMGGRATGSIRKSLGGKIRTHKNPRACKILSYPGMCSRTLPLPEGVGGVGGGGVGGGEGNLGGVRVGLGHRFAAAWVRVRAAFGDG